MSETKYLLITSQKANYWLLFLSAYLKTYELITEFLGVHFWFKYMLEVEHIDTTSDSQFVISSEK